MDFRTWDGGGEARPSSHAKATKEAEPSALSQLWSTGSPLGQGKLGLLRACRVGKEALGPWNEGAVGRFPGRRHLLAWTGCQGWRAQDPGRETPTFLT